MGAVSRCAARDFCCETPTTRRRTPTGTTSADRLEKSQRRVAAFITDTHDGSETTGRAPMIPLNHHPPDALPRPSTVTRYGATYHRRFGQYDRCRDAPDGSESVSAGRHTVREPADRAANAGWPRHLRAPGAAAGAAWRNPAP